MYAFMYRYDSEHGTISYSCYSGIVSSGDKVQEYDLLKKADKALSDYLKDAGKLISYPAMKSISPKVINPSPKNTFAVSGS
jgi:hypothetical protein